MVLTFVFLATAFFWADAPHGSASRRAAMVKVFKELIFIIVINKWFE
jgi:hypothetical protein